MPRRSRASTAALGAWSGLVLAGLYAPVAGLIAFSFNRSRYGGAWTGFTLEWYAALTRNEAILVALRRSLGVALAATAIAVVLGTLGALGVMGLSERRRRARGAAETLFHLPIVTPDIVQALALALFFHAVGVAKGLTTIAIAHAGFGTAYVYVVVSSALAHYRPTWDQAAMDLGARPLAVLLRVRLPILAPSVFAAALLVFTLSFDDFLIAFFNAGVRSTTLPIKVYSMIKFGVSPEVNALFTLVFAVTAVFMVAYFVLEKGRFEPREI